MKIFVFASSLTSTYWNGAATYYRGIYKNLHRRGYEIIFAEPDIYNRQQNRDESEINYADVRVYRTPGDIPALLQEASRCDLVIKHSGVGADDELLEREVLACQSERTQVAFWDVDAPATLERIERNEKDPFRKLIRKYDYIFTYGGGQPIVDHYSRLGAKACFPIYNALDPDAHHPVEPDPDLQCDLVFVGNRLPDRQGHARAGNSGTYLRSARRTSHLYLAEIIPWNHCEPGIPGRNLQPSLGAAVNIVIFGLSITSSWGNGHATTFRALAKALHQRKHRIVFFEKDQKWYASNRDLPNPEFCHVRLFDDWIDALPAVRRELQNCDVAVVGSYFPDGITASQEVLESNAPVKAFYDIDTPITIASLRQGRADYIQCEQVRGFDLYFSFTGGPVLEELQSKFHALRAVPLYCSFDPEQYFPRGVYRRYQCDLSYMRSEERR